MSDGWVNTTHWTNSKRATLVLRRSTLTECADLLPEDVLHHLRVGGEPEKVVRHLMAVGEKRGWLRDGCQPIAFWHDYARGCFMLMFTHGGLPETRDGDIPPEVDMVDGWEPDGWMSCDPTNDAAKVRP